MGAFGDMQGYLVEVTLHGVGVGEGQRKSGTCSRAGQMAPNR